MVTVNGVSAPGATVTLRDCVLNPPAETVTGYAPAGRVGNLNKPEPEESVVIVWELIVIWAPVIGLPEAVMICPATPPLVAVRSTPPIALKAFMIPYPKLWFQPPPTVLEDAVCSICCRIAAAVGYGIVMASRPASAATNGVDMEVP